ncbi:MAG: hypothetical protein LUG85_02055 [Clostridiales bacterium]|nr:hypothetical protein [Clostridiales bacterium]
MKIMKKSLCVILSLLFIMTGLSAGIVAFAADAATSAEYTSLALAFFKYSTSTSGATTTYTINTDSNGFPSLTIVGDMDQYEVSNESGDYEYADDSGSAIRAISYTHTVTAKDNSTNQIWNAANTYLGIASTLMSYEYGTGNYTVPMVTDAVADTLKTVKLNGEYLFLDGYTYIIDAYGDFVGRSVDKTYTVKNGEASYYSDSSDDVIFYDEYGNTGTLSELFSNTRTTSSGREIDLSTINEVTLFEACNVKTVLQYFSGNMTTVNSGNWFHDFVFNVYTDVETVLITETLQNRNLTIYNRTVTWTMNRSYDESGTKAQYYNNGYVIDAADTTTDTTRMELTSLQGVMNNYFSKYYADGVLAATTNDDLLNGYYADIMTYYDTFESISNEAKIAVFGADAYSYMNLVTQLTPIIGNTSLDEYTPSHTYEKYVDSSGNNVTYEVTTEKVTTIVQTLDNLLQSTKVGDIIKLFIDVSDDPDSVLFGVEANTAQEVLVQIIQYYLFSDDVLNLVIKYLYSTVCNLIDQYITDDFINGALGNLTGSSALDSLINSVILAVANTGDGWQALIYGALIGNPDIALTPAGIAYIWATTDGYLNTGNTEFDTIMQNNHDVLKAANGGVSSVAKGGYTTDDYNAIGTETDEYCGDRWKDVDYDKLVWNINGDQDKFLTYLDAVLAPIAPLLDVLLGNQEMKLEIGALGFDLYLVLNNIALYDDVLVPLLETLGITDLCPVSTFETYASAVNSGNRTKDDIETFLNEGLLNPILNWVTDVVLADPITVIAELLPNLSYYLTSGQLVESIKQLDIPIGVYYIFSWGTVSTLSVGDLLGDALDFLYSIQGILDLIGLSVDTGIAIVGYYDPSGNGRVYRPDDSYYNADTMTEEATGAYLSASGEMQIWKDGEFTTYITAYNDDGSYSDYAIFNVVGYANSSGYVVTQRTEDQVSTHTTEVYYYYEWTEQYEDGEEYTIRRTTAPTDGTEYTLVQSTVNATSTAELPAIMDYKLQACGTLTTTTSARTSSWALTNENGESETWAAYTRKYIKLEASSGEETSGLVLLYVFRYLFCALEYRAYSDGSFVGDYSILDAISGLRDILESELFSGFKLQDIIDNIALEPDEAIAAFYELFYPNETGSMYTVDANGKVVSGSDYVYDMDYVNYYHDEIMAAVKETGDTTYGSSVLYTEYWTKENSEYVIDNLDDMIEDVLSMLKLDVLGSSFDSIGGFLEDLLDQYLFNNEMLSTIAGALYGLLDSIDSFDLSGLLDAVFDIDYSKKTLAKALDYEFGTTVEVSQMLTIQSGNQGKTAYDDTTFYHVDTVTDVGTGGDIVIYTSYDWGFDNETVTAKYSNSEIFLRGLSAILSPFSIIIEYLLCGEDLSLLEVITIPGYDTYYYAWIPFMEALGADQDLLSYDQYYEKVFAGTNETTQNCDAFYYLLKPIMSFVDNLIASPVEFLFDIIPNVMFVLSIGGLNDILNNLLHFAYVLLDMIQPIYDVYPLLNSLLSNIRIGDIVLNIAIPLDFDFNQLVNDLIEGLLGDLLSFDIENKNIVLGTYEAEEEVFVPTLDDEGNEQIDENGAVIGEYVTQTVTKEQYAVGTLNITLPYIDLTTFCAGTVTEMVSKSYNLIIYLDSSGGADLLTLLLRLVVDTLFYEDNAMNIADFLIGYCQLDDEYDNDDLLIEIFTYLNSEALNNDYPDKTLKLLYTVYSVLVQITGNLGYRFQNVDFSIIDMFSDMSNITSYITALMNAGESSNSTLSGFALLIEKLRAFFQAIVDFFRSLFGMS